MSARDKRAFESDLKNFMKAFNMTRGRALDAVANRVREDAQSILDTQGTSDTGVLKNKQILLYRFSFYGGKKYTLKHIGEEMGISPETVRQIEIRAIKKLREHAVELKEYIYN